MTSIPTHKIRKIGRQHIAFYIGYIEGIDLAKLADIYLETGSDTRKAKTVINWLRDVFIAAAQSESPSLTKLLRINPSALLEATKATSLEDFRKQVDPGNFYTEAELIELYKDQHQSDRRSIRNGRIRQKIITAIRVLSEKLESEPSADHLISQWFDRNISDRLANSTPPLILFKDILDQMEIHGGSWNKAVPWLGKRGAARIENWMIRYGMIPEIGVKGFSKSGISKNSFIPWGTLTFSPALLSGKFGDNRAIGNQLDANNDRDAIEAWLASLGSWQTHTLRSYRNNAERFLLWMIVEKGRPLSSATTEDCSDYRDFLDSLGELDSYSNKVIWRWNLPRDQWIGKKCISRGSKFWRPFNGPLSQSSQNLAITIPTIMCEWLVRKKYLDSNPFLGVKKHKQLNKIKKNRHIPESLMEACFNFDYLGSQDERYFRIKAVLTLTYGTGLRLAELADLKVSSNYVDGPGLRMSEDENSWEIEVVGKGKRQRIIPISKKVLMALAEYMGSKGFGLDPSNWKPGTPLVTSLSDQFQKTGHSGGLSHSALYRLIANHFKSVAKTLNSDGDREKLARVSTHWLRHSFATHLIRCDIPLVVVQELLGHSSPATTSIYVDSGKKKRREAVELI